MSVQRRKITRFRQQITASWLLGISFLIWESARAIAADQQIDTDTEIDIYSSPDKWDCRPTELLEVMS
jgi:hypothetical protein